jgi:hypothetical protein
MRAKQRVLFRKRAKNREGKKVISGSRHSFVFIRAAFLGAVLVATTQCSSARGEHWRVVGQISGAMPIEFVEVDKASAQDGAVYKDAVSALCPDGSHCDQIAFYLPGDPVPPNSDDPTFFRAGGFKPYPAIAIYTGGEFTKWDCDRAGSKDAPVSALCGEVGVQYDAVEKLAARVSWTRNCHAPATQDEQLVHQFIGQVPDKERAAEYEKAYTQLALDPSGPDDPRDCDRLAPRIEREAKEARQVLQRQMSSPSRQP